MPSVRETLYKYSLHKGKEAEKRSLEQIRSHYREMPWILRARHATKIEDAHGIDVVVHTKETGEFFIQIKSSFKNLDKFRRKHPGDDIAGVIIREEYSDEKVWQEVKSVLLGLKERYKKLTRQA
jgi:hypothetical protein